MRVPLEIDAQRRLLAVYPHLRELIADSDDGGARFLHGGMINVFGHAGSTKEIPRGGTSESTVIEARYTWSVIGAKDVLSTYSGSLRKTDL